jgi:hypothetical protein
MYVIPEHKYIIVRSAASVVVSPPVLPALVLMKRAFQQALCSVSKRVDPFRKTVIYPGSIHRNFVQLKYPFYPNVTTTFLTSPTENEWVRVLSDHASLPGSSGDHW